MSINKLGADCVYDYRDDPNIAKQNEVKGIFRWGRIRFGDEDFNPIWAMYRPPASKAMGDQLNGFYRTPMPDREAKKSDGIFSGGIPYNILAPFAEFWLQHPLLKPLRRTYENCKVEKQNPQWCVLEAAEYVQTMNRIAEQPFAKCPKASVAWVKCLDDNMKNYHFCRDLQVEWEACMQEHFDLKLPPFPKNPQRLEWNGGQDAPYRNRFKCGARDMDGDLFRHVGLGTVHPETDRFHENL